MIDIIEFPDRPEPSLLVCAGNGLMMSLMDQCRRFRYCTDADQMTAGEQYQFGAWLAEKSPELHMIAFAGWYCATNPVQIANALRRANWKKVAAVYVQCHGPYEDDPFEDLRTVHSVEALIAAINAFPAPSPVDLAIAASPVKVRRMTWNEYQAAA